MIEHGADFTIGCDCDKCKYMAAAPSFEALQELMSAIVSSGFMVVKTTMPDIRDLDGSTLSFELVPRVEKTSAYHSFQKQQREAAEAADRAESPAGRASPNKPVAH